MSCFFKVGRPSWYFGQKWPCRNNYSICAYPDSAPTFPLNLLVLIILRAQARRIIYGEDSRCFHFSCKSSEQNDKMQGQTTLMLIFQSNYHEFDLPNLINSIISIVYSKLSNKRNTRGSESLPVKSEMTAR